MNKVTEMAGPTEQTYYAASVENALMVRAAIERRIADAVVGAEASNDLLREAVIASSRLVTARP